MVQRWYPFAELRRMEDTINRLSRGFGGHGAYLEGSEAEGWTVPLDVVEEGDKLVVHASMPGIRPEDIQVSIEDNVLTIKGETRSEGEQQEANYLMRERRAGSFYRAVRLPESVDTEKAESTYDHGVLSIALPKVEHKKAKRLEIKVSSGAKSIEGKKS